MKKTYCDICGKEVVNGYKKLHKSELLTMEDREGLAGCIDVCFSCLTRLADAQKNEITKIKNRE